MRCTGSTVAAIHNGFSSKAARPEHEAAVKLIDGYVNEIVASPPAGSGSAKAQSPTP